MNQNKKPSWKERFSNWAMSSEGLMIMNLLSVFFSGVAIGISITKFLLT